MGSHKKRRKHSTSSEDSDDRKHSKRKKRDKAEYCMKKRKPVPSSSSSTSSSTSLSSSTDSEEERRLKKQKKLKRLQKRDKQKQHKEKKEKATGGSLDIPLELMTKSKAMAPMTKEEWEKRQSVVKRVYDESTGRHRLIKGNGEVIEEIVSRDRHKSINQQATRGDGDYFQAHVANYLKK